MVLGRSERESGAQGALQREDAQVLAGQAFPERLVPFPIGGETEEERRLREQAAALPEGKSERTVLLREAYEEHQKALREAPDLPPDERLKTIKQFQRTLREAEAAREAVRRETSPEEKRLWLAHFAERREEANKILEEVGPLSFEKAYRQYLASRREFIDFEAAGRRLREIDQILTSAAFPEKEDDATSRKAASAARAEHLISRRGADEQVVDLQSELVLIYPEGSEEYRRTLAELEALEGAPLAKDRGALQQEHEALQRKREALWEDPMVQRFHKEREIRTLLADIDRGQDVLEFPSTIRLLNQLHEWEELHPNTTVGGILVGEPGVGKTTLVRHYLEQKGRSYEYIDLSGEVTRYTLFGARSVHFETEQGYFEHLQEAMSKMTPEEALRLIKENADKFRKMMPKLSEDESIAIATDALREAIDSATRSAEEMNLSKEEADELGAKAREALEEVAGRAYRQELSSKFAEFVSKNGWRDGAIIHALRNGSSLILDEFNKAKEWSLLYGLLTAKPGEKWFFADNNEWIDIPKDWRMYFTANIGRKHGGFEVAEALASRAAGRVMEVQHMPFREEVLLALATISSPDGRVLRSSEDMARVGILVKEVFPMVRDSIKDQRQAIPVAIRTIRDLGEKLIRRKDSEGRPLYQTTGKSMDEAVWETMVMPYALYEDTSVPEGIVKKLTEAGFLLGDEFRSRIVPNYLSEEEFDRLRESQKDYAKEFEKLAKEMQGEGEASLTLQMPEGRSF